MELIYRPLRRPWNLVSFFRRLAHVQSNCKPPKTLITGGLGQLGTVLAAHLRKKYGKENVLLTDVKKPNDAILSEGPYTYVNVLNYDEMEAIVVNERIDWIVNFSALLSAVAEENVSHAMAVNMKGFENCINLAKVHNLKVFCPSTIGAFGPTSPKMNTPDLTIQRPRTIYGVTKVYVELLGEYYHHCFDTDFRSIRFPGVVSALTPPGGGTTDYAVHIFYDALQNGYYKCFLREDSRLPMIYIDDCIRATVALMETPDSKLSMRTYNINALSFTPEELTNELRRHIPQLKVEYVPDHRQAIADSWPESLNDETARKDWGWNPNFNLEKMVQTMLAILKCKTQV